MIGFEAMQATPVYFWLICFLSVMAAVSYTHLTLPTNSNV